MAELFSGLSEAPAPADDRNPRGAARADGARDRGWTYVESVTVMVDDDPAGRRDAATLAQLLRPRVLEVRPVNLTELRGAP
jgi:hypothetical protein